MALASYDNLGSFATVPLGQLAVVPIAAALGSTHVAIAGAILWAALGPRCTHRWAPPWGL